MGHSGAVCPVSRVGDSSRTSHREMSRASCHPFDQFLRLLLLQLHHCMHDFEITIRTLVNVLLLAFYIRMVSISLRFSSLDLIFSHLTVANTMILLTLGILETLSAWGWRNFLSDVGCKFLMYSPRVVRGLPICTTCLLSIFQAVTIIPGNPQLARIKASLPTGVVLSCLLSWCLSLLVSVRVKTIPLIIITFSLCDLIFVGLVRAASGYLVFILYRHHRRVRNLHGPGCSSGAMSEVRVDKRVTALAALCVLLYGEQSIMLSVILNMKEKSPLLGWGLASASSGGDADVREGDDYEPGGPIMMPKDILQDMPNVYTVKEFLLLLQNMFSSR
ncbi:olfactory receptor class A-like protein 1 [Tachyglossus aculeatus]|uniref:olfactory receptor class A-like protein 1 n=1 Tax=Tachyglossus aculeatus TaxID=9261 RepID=UPI0018F32E06|nr:olfactory receptor class A-like protein 1 [Tachyglossus aculeatus]